MQRPPFPVPTALLLWLAAPWLPLYPAAAQTDTPAAGVHLSGAAAWSALVGNTITGKTPDGPYTEFFRPGGEVVHSDGDGLDRGRWVLRDPLVCFSFPEDDAEDCRTPEVDGPHGAFVDRDGSRYPFDVLNGNAKNF